MVFFIVFWSVSISDIRLLRLLNFLHKKEDLHVTQRKPRYIICPFSHLHELTVPTPPPTTVLLLLRKQRGGNRVFDFVSLSSDNENHFPDPQSLQLVRSFEIFVLVPVQLLDPVFHLNQYYKRLGKN